MTVKPSNPNKRHAIGHNQGCICQDPPKMPIVFGFHDAVHSGHGDVATRIATCNPLAYLPDHVWDLQRVNVYAEDREGIRT